MAAKTMSSDVALSFTADIYKKLFPAEYMKRCMENNVRPDSRTLEAARAVHLQTNVVQTASSSSLVKIGNTSVITAIKLAVGTPAVSTPDQGDLGGWDAQPVSLCLQYDSEIDAFVDGCVNPNSHSGPSHAIVLYAIQPWPSIGRGTEHRQSADQHYYRVRG